MAGEFSVFLLTSTLGNIRNLRSWLLGCGNPTTLAQLNRGETVLDLGSGGGIDMLLSACPVGPSGKVYGPDITVEMLALARENQREAGIENLEFLKCESSTCRCVTTPSMSS